MNEALSTLKDIKWLIERGAGIDEIAEHIPTINKLLKNDESYFINGEWYSHTEKGQEKFLILVHDAENMICSGWDCKGNYFSKKWVYLGNRLTKVVDHHKVEDVLVKEAEKRKYGYEGYQFSQTVENGIYTNKLWAYNVFPIVCNHTEVFLDGEWEVEKEEGL